MLGRSCEQRWNFSARSIGSEFGQFLPYANLSVTGSPSEPPPCQSRTSQTSGTTSMTSLATRRRRKRILFTLGVLVATASYNPAHGQDLGQLSANPYAPN